MQLPQLDYLVKDKESVLICARSSFVHLVDEALFLGPQLPILVVQKLESLLGRGYWGGVARGTCADFAPGGWKAGCSSSTALSGDMLDADWNQKPARMSLWHLRWMEAGSGTSVTVFEGL